MINITIIKTLSPDDTILSEVYHNADMLSYCAASRIWITQSMSTDAEVISYPGIYTASITQSAHI